MGDPETPFAAYHHRLFRYFCRAVGQPDLARDLTQDVLVRVSRTAIRPTEEGSIRAWLFSISLDFFGDPTAAPRSDGVAIHLDARSRLMQGGQPSLILRQGNMMTAREVKADLTVKPGEVVDVALPRLSENDAGAFANRSYSIRIRSRQLR